MKNMKKVLAITVCFVFIGIGSAFAQMENIKGIQFKDGSIVYGRVIKLNADEIQIETKDGKIISRKSDEVVILINNTGVDATKESNALVESPDASSINQKSNTFQMGIMYYYFDYKEDLILPSKSTEYGWLPGIYVDYTFKKRSAIYTKFFLNYAGADITYDGSTQSGTPVKFTDQQANMLKAEVNIGYAIPIGKDFTLIPYTGYNYHYWQRGTTKLLVTPEASWTKEVYQWHNIPVGIKADYNITDKFNIAASAAANIMFASKLTLCTSDEGSGLPDFEFNLGNKIGFYTEIPITYKFTGNFGISVTPWYEYNAFGESAKKYYIDGGNLYNIYEPASKTNKYGVNVGVMFSF